MASTPGRKPNGSDLSPSLNDPAEALQRIIPRRQLRIEDGDIVIVRVAGGFRTLARDVYQVQVRGEADRPDRFAGFDRAAASAEQLANSKKVRLFYVDKDGEAPQLLNDFRGA